MIEQWLECFPDNQKRPVGIQSVAESRATYKPKQSNFATYWTHVTLLIAFIWTELIDKTVQPNFLAKNYILILWYKMESIWFHFNHNNSSQ